MQPASSTLIPDGLLAAMALLSENSRLGLKSKTPALHPGHIVPNSTAAIGDSWSVASEIRWSHQMGRWMSPEWADKPEAVPYSDLDNPQSLNLYGYVGNNPLSRADKDGHCYPVCTAIVGGLIGAGVNVGITYFTNPNATRNDYIGAAASGFITGAVAGVTGGASLGVQVGVNAGANVVGGVVERSISAGHLEVGSAKEVATDAAIGAAGPLLSAAGGKIAKAINGKDAEALGEAAKGAHLGERHAASLNKQAAAASAFDEAGRKAGDNAGKVVDGANRANDNLNKDKKDHQ